MTTELIFSCSSKQDSMYKYNILSFDFNIFKEQSERTGVVDKKSIFSKFEVEVVADLENSHYIYECYIKHTRLSGEIVVDNSQNSIYDNEPDFRSIIFIDAQIFSLDESYKIENCNQRTLTVRFVCRELSVEGVEFSLLKSQIRI